MFLCNSSFASFIAINVELKLVLHSMISVTKSVQYLKLKPSWNCLENVLTNSHLIYSALNDLCSAVLVIWVFQRSWGIFLGATRDIGACLTRVCMRQRSIENRLRGFVDSLTDELATNLQNKGSHWKQRTMEMDRHANKFCRKVNCKVPCLAV